LNPLVAHFKAGSKSEHLTVQGALTAIKYPKTDPTEKHINT
jgi:hypothetical protein